MKDSIIKDTKVKTAAFLDISSSQQKGEAHSNEAKSFPLSNNKFVRAVTKGEGESSSMPRKKSSYETTGVQRNSADVNVQDSISIRSKHKETPPQPENQFNAPVESNNNNLQKIATEHSRGYLADQEEAVDDNDSAHGHFGDKEHIKPTYSSDFESGEKNSIHYGTVSSNERKDVGQVDGGMKVEIDVHAKACGTDPFTESKIQIELKPQDIRQNNVDGEKNYNKHRDTAYPVIETVNSKIENRLETRGNEQNASPMYDHHINNENVAEAVVEYSIGRKDITSQRIRPEEIKSRLKHQKKETQNCNIQQATNKENLAETVLEKGSSDRKQHDPIDVLMREEHIEDSNFILRSTDQLNRNSCSPKNVESILAENSVADNTDNGDASLDLCLTAVGNGLNARKDQIDESYVQCDVMSPRDTQLDKYNFKQESNDWKKCDSSHSRESASKKLTRSTSDQDQSKAASFLRDFFQALDRKSGKKEPAQMLADACMQLSTDIVASHNPCVEDSRDLEITQPSAETLGNGVERAGGSMKRKEIDKHRVYADQNVCKPCKNKEKTHPIKRATLPGNGNCEKDNIFPGDSVVMPENASIEKKNCKIFGTNYKDSFPVHKNIAEGISKKSNLVDVSNSVENHEETEDNTDWQKHFSVGFRKESNTAVLTEVTKVTLTADGSGINSMAQSGQIDIKEPTDLINVKGTHIPVDKSGGQASTIVNYHKTEYLVDNQNHCEFNAIQSKNIGHCFEAKDIHLDVKSNTDLAPFVVTSSNAKSDAYSYTYVRDAAFDSGKNSVANPSSMIVKNTLTWNPNARQLVEKNDGAPELEKTDFSCKVEFKSNEEQDKDTVGADYTPSFSKSTKENLSGNLAALQSTPENRNMPIQNNIHKEKNNIEVTNCSNEKEKDTKLKSDECSDYFETTNNVPSLLVSSSLLFLQGSKDAASCTQEINSATSIQGTRFLSKSSNMGCNLVNNFCAISKSDIKATSNEHSLENLMTIITTENKDKHLPLLKMDLNISNGIIKDQTESNLSEMLQGMEIEVVSWANKTIDIVATSKEQAANCSEDIDGSDLQNKDSDSCRLKTARNVIVPRPPRGKSKSRPVMGRQV